MSQILLPEYHMKKFVNRNNEIEIFRGILSELLSGASPPKRTITLKGERGIGKSWLLAHLREETQKYVDDEKALVFRLDLNSYTGWDDPVQVVVNALKQFADILPNRPVHLGANPADISRRVMEAARQVLTERVLVVFVDHVYESDWKLLAGLEDYLLGPLAIESRTLIVLAGRGREYPWKTPELRLRAEFKVLQPFNVEDTSDQLKKQVSPQVAERTNRIYELSKGNPIANYLIATEGESAKALDTVIKVILEVVPENERQEIRDQLEALSVLRAFDEERIPELLSAYYYDNEEKREEYKDWSYAQARRVRESLVRYAFARWDHEEEGFVIDELVRNIFEQYLRKAEPERWKALQQAARQLYLNWQEKYKKDFWEKDIEYHEQELQLVSNENISPMLVGQ